MLIKIIKYSSYLKNTSHYTLQRLKIFLQTARQVERKYSYYLKFIDLKITLKHVCLIFVAVSTQSRLAQKLVAKILI